MANPSRGEVEVVLGDTTFTLRPSFTIIREIEATLGSIFDLGRKLATGQISATEMATVIFICVRKDPDHRKIKLDEIGEMLYEAGIADHIKTLQSFFVSSVDPGKAVIKVKAGDDNAEGEAKAA